MISKKSLQDKITSKLNQTIQYGQMCNILDELNIKPQTQKVSIQTKNGIIENEVQLYDEDIVDEMVKRHLNNLALRGRAINIQEIINEQKLTREQVRGIIRRLKLPYTHTGSGNKTECWLVGKYKTQFFKYMQTQYKPNKPHTFYKENDIEQIAITEQTDETKVLEMIQNLVKKVEIYEKNEKMFRQIIDKKDSEIRELQNQLRELRNQLGERKNNFITKVMQIVRG